MFEFLDDILNAPPKKVEYVNLNEGILFNPDIVKEKLFNINSLTDAELMDIVKKSYAYILDEVYNKNNTFMPLFTNERFLTMFLQVVRSVNLVESQKITINKICYDYFTTFMCKDSLVTDLLFNMSKVVNQDVLPGLLGLGLYEELADYLALSRFSTSKDLVNVKRVNFIITRQPSSVMTEQMIVNIYSKLYDSVTPLFTGTLLDVEEFDDDEISEEASLVYSTISNAVLDILETLPLEQIRQVLLSYNITRVSYYQDKDVRFTMNALSDDYARINMVVESLRQEGVYLP